MDEPTSAAAFTTVPTAPVSQNPNSQHQPQLFHHQLMLLHQFQQQQQQQQQQQHSQQQLQPNPNLYSLQQQRQQQQSIMSRFPSNIDAHLRPPGIRSSNFNHFNQASIPNSFVAVNNVAVVQHQMQQQQAAQTLKTATTSHTAAARQGDNHKEIELAQQDALMVTNPDLKRPFDSIEDAVDRLLPYHVLADYEAEEEDDILNNDTTGQAPSRQQQWDHTILSKIEEFNNTFEKQVMAFNIMTKKRRVGEFRSEERLMIEQLLLQDELQAINGIKAEQDSKERADREAAEARMRMAMAQAEQARAQSQMTSSRLSDPVMRSNAAVASQGDDDVDDRNEEPTEDFLNDDDDEEADEDDDEDGELNLNEGQ